MIFYLLCVLGDFWEGEFGILGGGSHQEIAGINTGLVTGPHA